jgi:hypothetical protein
MQTRLSPADPESGKLSFQQIEERIRARAYEIYEERGRGNGHALDDWLEAEGRPGIQNGTRSSRRHCRPKCILRRSPRASVDSARAFTRWVKQTNAHFELTSSRHLRVLKPA